MDKLTDIARMTWQYLALVARRFMDDGCQHSAAALTYMTLFAVVPMMTVTFSMFSLVPAFQGVGTQVQDLIFSNLLPSVGAEVESYLEGFSSQARKLSGLGVIILVVTAYLMLHNIESVFNRIWKTTGPRRGVTAFLLYWAVLSLGPLLVGTALLMNTYLLSIQIFTDNIAQNALNIAFGYLPWFLTASAFTLLYVVVPNCKVMLRNALTGGIVATIAFEIAKAGFGYFVANSSYTSIYGAFATLPIFLLWIYLCWMIVLAGAEFVRTTESFNSEIRGKLPQHASAVFALWIFWQAHKAGEEVSESRCLKAGLSADGWRYVRDRLLQKKIISVTEAGNYVLMKSLDTLGLWDIYRIFPGFVKMPDKAPKVLEPRIETADSNNQWWQEYINLVSQFESVNSELMAVKLSELFENEVDEKFEEKIKQARLTEVS